MGKTISTTDVTNSPNSAALDSYKARRTQTATTEYGIPHWLRSETSARLPQSRANFDDARDPSVPLQKAAMQQTESQRRRDMIYQQMRQSNKQARGSNMVRDGKPHPTLRPPKPMSIGPDRAAFSRKWMEEKVQAAQKLTNDRNALARQKQQLGALAARHQKQTFHPKSREISELERQFYIQKRQAEAVMGQSQKHIQKFQRRMSQ